MTNDGRIWTGESFSGCIMVALKNGRECGKVLTMASLVRTGSLYYRRSASENIFNGILDLHLLLNIDEHTMRLKC